jgi:hypothetical protein
LDREKLLKTCGSSYRASRTISQTLLPKRKHLIDHR